MQNAEIALSTLLCVHWLIAIQTHVEKQRHIAAVREEIRVHEDRIERAKQAVRKHSKRKRAATSGTSAFNRCAVLCCVRLNRAWSQAHEHRHAMRAVASQRVCPCAACAYVACSLRSLVPRCVLLL